MEGPASGEWICPLGVFIVSKHASQRHCVEHHVAFYTKDDVFGAYTRTAYIRMSDSLQPCFPAYGGVQYDFWGCALAEDLRAGQELKSAVYNAATKHCLPVFDRRGEGQASEWDLAE